MFCPKCGSTQSDDLKFCKLCGANLFAVRQVVDTRETEGFDWTKTWVAEMFMSPQELKRRKEEAERQHGITPEMKRYNEIKAGIITGTVGIGIAIFLYVFMQGIILSGNVTANSAEILSRLWIAGVLPMFVGISLIINGVFVSKKLVESARRDSQNLPSNLEGDVNPQSLGPADTTEVIPSGFSVTEHTTKHLRSSGQKQ
ncbi:MAG: zinc ribbon domain-containing protein [Acidobacteriota bacterium]|nr:zinc ribbon domain-containing protein [Acidobacteriota bacterium]